MKTKKSIIALLVIATFTTGAVAYAQGPGGGSGGSMMGGGGQGMMGGGGHGMMGGGKGVSYFLELISNKLDKSKQNNDGETENLRREIREKRRELASLYRSENADNRLIDQKIEELNGLEAELDERLAASD